MMRVITYILSFLLLILLGSWAYREGYETRTALREMRELQDEIAQLREDLAVTRAEWAYLNRPQRLRELADANFGHLGLAPMEPRQFGHAADVPLRPSGAMAGGQGLDGVTDAVAEIEVAAGTEGAEP